MTDTAQMIDSSPATPRVGVAAVAATVDACLECVQACSTCADADLLEADVDELRRASRSIRTAQTCVTRRLESFLGLGNGTRSSRTACCSRVSVCAWPARRSARSMQRITVTARSVSACVVRVQRPAKRSSTTRCSRASRGT